jgi:hypothetical protein
MAGERTMRARDFIDRRAEAPRTSRGDATGVDVPRVPDTGARVRRCLFIEGDPVAELRAGRDPHCNARVAEGRVYCARHARRAYYRPEES